MTNRQFYTTIFLMLTAGPAVVILGTWLALSLGL